MGTNLLLLGDISQALIGFVVIVVVLFVIGFLALLVRCYRKVEQGTAIIRNGMGGSKVSFTGIFVIPVLHRAEYMDISAKRIEIHRMGETGLVCQDNLRADVQVAFFVRVNKTERDVLNVAQCLGCRRASDPQALVEFFDAKFSEALKTVGKQFDFVDLYTNREQLKEEVLRSIGEDLNGYVLDDAAIDYLEQTDIDKLDPNNILDAEGIEKIVRLTATQAELANARTRVKDQTIKKQDVECRERILELERQQIEAEQKQAREVAEVTARQQAEAVKVQQEERLKAERARIQTDEEVSVAEENKDRQIIVATRNKEKTDGVEQERVKRDRDLEATDREKLVGLAQIAKDKEIEVEKKNIQEVIRERVMVEREVVVEEEKIKDTRAYAGADRQKRVKVTEAEEQASQDKVKEVVAAEAGRDASKLQAEELVIEAEAQRAAAEKEAAARITLADAKSQEEAVVGIGEARALEAKATATEKLGTAEATVIQRKGEAEADIMGKKYHADANGITEKAEAMKLFNAAGKEHEEFKIQIDKDLQIELAAINVQKEIAEEQAKVMGEALRQAKIDIVGGDGQFFDSIIHSITGGKSVDRYIDSSKALTDVKETFFNGDADYFKEQLQSFVDQFGMTSEDLKNVTVSALLAKMFGQADSEEMKQTLQSIAAAAKKAGIADKMIDSLGLGVAAKK